MSAGFFIFEQDSKKNATPARFETLAYMQGSTFFDNDTIPSDSHSSVLIPELLEKFFKERCKLHGGRRHYFSYLIRDIVPRSDLYRDQILRRRTPKWKTSYQASGQNLLKRNFMPDSAEWECFRNVASAHGVSMCFLFAIILELDSMGHFSNSAPKSTSLAGNSLPKEPQKGVANGGMGFLGRWIDLKDYKLTRIDYRRQ